MVARQEAPVRPVANPGVVFLAIFLPAASVLANQPPVIDDFRASTTTVAPGGTVTLTVDAHDPDCPDTCTTGCGLYIRSDVTDWRADGGAFVREDNGTSGSPYAANADWQAPAVEGTYRVSVYVADSGGFTCGGRQSTEPWIDILVAVTTNEPPVVDSLVADPRQVFPGGTSDLTCSATDPEGDPISYSWETDSGTVTPGGGGAAVFTAAGPGIATVTCTASDPSAGFGQDFVAISVTDTVGEKWIDAGLVAPQRLSVDSRGSVYVVDRSARGITVVNLFSGELVYRLPLPGATSVAVDWNDNLLVGNEDGAEVLTPRGAQFLALDSAEPSGDVSDVAVDLANRRYGVLYRKAGRIAVYDDTGAQIAAFGSTGDAAEQLKSPQGLAATPDGDWLVADSGNGQIKKFDLAGNLVSSFGSLGGGVGEFVALDDVTVGADGVIFASDAFQTWVQSFEPDGTPRELLGTFGDGVGEFKTVTGVTLAESFDRMLATSTNSSRVQVFLTATDPPATEYLPVGTADPTILAFGGQQVGTTGAPLGVTVGNSGNAPLGIRAIEITEDFDSTHDCGAYVDPGTTCTVQVTFAPTTPGAHDGSMVVETSAKGGSLVIALNGNGVIPAGLQIDPGTAGFADQEIGTVSDPMLVTLSNHGTEPLQIFSIGASASYVEAHDCGVSLAGGARCYIDVRFAPDTVADHVPGAITVNSDAVGSPHTVVLDGSAVPVQPVIGIADLAVDEGDGENVSADFEITLSTTSTSEVSVRYGTAADSAIEGQDYDPVSGILVFAPGETSHPVSVPVLGDVILEPDEKTLFLDLSGAVNGTLDRRRATATIVDDENCPGPILPANAGAEERPDGPGIPGWTQLAGGDWQPLAGGPAPVEGESVFFAGASAFAELAQDIDVSMFADAIDAGRQRFAFEVWVHSVGEAVPDTTRVVLEFRNLDNTFVLEAFDSGEIASTLGWQQIVDEITAPRGTGWIRVRLISSRSTGPDNDGYFDAVSLRSLRAPTLEIVEAFEYEGDPGRGNEVVVPVRLACPYYQEIEADFGTHDGSAVEGEDYLGLAGTVALAVGETVDLVSVRLVGDDVDEPHETVRLSLESATPDDIVPVFPDGFGTIVNDDFCARPADFWVANPDLWMLDRLDVGGVRRDRDGMMSLLQYAGNNLPSELARELVATRLGLAVGSDPIIGPSADDADAYLVQFPPESDPQGNDEADGRRLLARLGWYNAAGCTRGQPPGVTPQNPGPGPAGIRNLQPGSGDRSPWDESR